LELLVDDWHSLIVWIKERFFKKQTQWRHFGDEDVLLTIQL
jgi:hypothetical protein